MKAIWRPPPDATLIALDDYRPHRVGNAICGSCGKRWVTVGPDARQEAHGMECPACGAMTGVEIEQAIATGPPLLV